MATLLRGQTAEALRAIRRNVAGKLEPYARGGALEFPTRAFMICAQQEPAH